MKRCLFALGVFALVAVAVAADPPKKLGPEWTYDKEAQHYFKMMQIKSVRSGAGGVGNYYLDLEHDKVWVSDSDDNIATSVHLNQTLSLEVRKDPKGVSSGITADVNGCLYRDLNCDGAWDTWYDRRDGASKLCILYDNQWIQVRYFRGQITNGTGLFSLDKKTTYTWNGKVWNAQPAKN